MRKPMALILSIITAVVLALANTSVSPSTNQGAGKVSTRDFSFVVINGDDIRSLPSGENRLVQESGNTAGASGGTWFLRNSNSPGSPLVKTGTGTLILPNSNTYGVTKVGPGTLRNTPIDGSSMKQGQGRLVLNGANPVVYEFRNFGPAELARVFLPNGTTSISINFTKIAFATGSGSQNATKRLLLGPAGAIAQIEGWKVGTRPPVSRYTCSGGSCVCNGTADCLSLASSCSSDMSCAGTGSDIRCSCKK
jgi:hypothetical protein